MEAKADQKPFKGISAPMWRTLTMVAERGDIGYGTGSGEALIRRGLLVERDKRDGFGHPRLILSELGQRVYARLSVGPMCCRCGRPVAFERRTALPGGKSECLRCGARP